MARSVMEATMMHHVIIVLLLLWWLSYLNRSHAVLYFLALIYIYLVHERYVMGLRKKLQFEEMKQANQRRVLSDSESARWLNHAIEKIWPICMEQIASQKILLPIIPWFLEKYRPWPAKKVVVQHLYLGRSPPILTDIRVLRQSTGDDHLVLELGMNFLTADDMSAILAVKLRKRLGFGMWAKLHLTGMHVEGKVLIGVKFLRQWPFLGRLRVCFAEPPYFQMTVKPIFTHGLDVAILPGIAGWLDKLLSIAFEQTLVEPNMLVVDVVKFISPESENWFFVDEKEPVAHALVEVIEALDVKPSDLNGLADPYVKGQLGPSKFKTKVQRKTLAPKWQEEFKIPILAWDSPNILAIEVRDKDRFVDDTLGDCTVNIGEFRDGQRHVMWLPLQNIKMGRLCLAITVLEDNARWTDNLCDGKTINKEDIANCFASDTTFKVSFSSVESEKSPRVADNFEPINIEGQQETGIWVHKPGSEVSQIWEPRKGKNRRIDNQIQRVPNDSFGSGRPTASASLNNESSSTDENQEGRNPLKSVVRGLKKIGLAFHRNRGKDEQTGSIEGDFESPRVNVKAVREKEIGVKFIVEDSLSGPLSGKAASDGSLSPEGSCREAPQKGHMKGVAKSILRNAERSARHLKQKLSRKGSRKSHGDAAIVVEQDIALGSGCDSNSDTETESESEFEDDKIPTLGTKPNPAIFDPVIGQKTESPKYLKPEENDVHSNGGETTTKIEGQKEHLDTEDLERTENDGKVVSSGVEDAVKESPKGQKRESSSSDK